MKDSFFKLFVYAEGIVGSKCTGQHAKYVEVMVHPYCTTRAPGSVI